jgi:transcriptional regulator with XRE-family HTH domain
MNIVDQITKAQNLTQKELANRLGVSPTQITKWKQGETISKLQLEKFKEEFGLFGDNPKFSLLMGNDSNKAKAWYDLFEYFYDEIDDFEVDGKIFVEFFLLTLSELDVTLPDDPHIIDNEKDEDSLWSEFLSIHSFDYQKRINWAYSYMCPDESLDDNNFTLFTLYQDIYHSAGEVALSKISPEIITKLGASENKFQDFIRKTERETMSRISELCENIFNKGVPLRKDYYRFVMDDPEELDEDVYFDFDMGYTADNFISLSERKILASLVELNERVKSLEEKIEFSLPKK